MDSALDEETNGEVCVFENACRALSSRVLFRQNYPRQDFVAYLITHAKQDGSYPEAISDVSEKVFSYFQPSGLPSYVHKILGNQKLEEDLQELVLQATEAFDHQFENVSYLTPQAIWYYCQKSDRVLRERQKREEDFASVLRVKEGELRAARTPKSKKLANRKHGGLLAGKIPVPDTVEDMNNKIELFENIVFETKGLFLFEEETVHFVYANILIELALEMAQKKAENKERSNILLYAKGILDEYISRVRCARSKLDTFEVLNSFKRDIFEDNSSYEVWVRAYQDLREGRKFRIRSDTAELISQRSIKQSIDLQPSVDETELVGAYMSRSTERATYASYIMLISRLRNVQTKARQNIRRAWNISNRRGEAQEEVTFEKVEVPSILFSIEEYSDFSTAVTGKSVERKTSRRNTLPAEALRQERKENVAYDPGEDTAGTDVADEDKNEKPRNPRQRSMPGLFGGRNMPGRRPDAIARLSTPIPSSFEAGPVDPSPQLPRGDADPNLRWGPEHIEFEDKATAAGSEQKQRQNVKHTKYSFQKAKEGRRSDCEGKSVLPPTNPQASHVLSVEDSRRQTNPGLQIRTRRKSVPVGSGNTGADATTDTNIRDSVRLSAGKASSSTYQLPLPSPEEHHSLQNRNKDAAETGLQTQHTMTFDKNSGNQSKGDDKLCHEQVQGRNAEALEETAMRISNDLLALAEGGILKGDLSPLPGPLQQENTLVAKPAQSAGPEYVEPSGRTEQPQLNQTVTNYQSEVRERNLNDQGQPNSVPAGQNRTDKNVEFDESDLLDLNQDKARGTHISGGDLLDPNEWHFDDKNSGNQTKNEERQVDPLQPLHMGSGDPRLVSHHQKAQESAAERARISSNVHLHSVDSFLLGALPSPETIQKEQAIFPHEPEMQQILKVPGISYEDAALGNLFTTNGLVAGDLDKVLETVNKYFNKPADDGQDS